MEKPRHRIQFDLTAEDNRRLQDLCGQFDQNLRQIERFLGVEINNRGQHFQIIGRKKFALQARDVIEKIFEETKTPNVVNGEKVHLILQSVVHKNGDNVSADEYKSAGIKTRQIVVTPRSENQYHYIKHIQSHDINFGIGPSGTGKTYLAVACAAAALEAEKVQRIILVRPAVEAGEKLGFLPGDLAQKVDPYLRPLYDALYEMMGIETVDRLIHKGVIEVAPLAYMRGRTLNEAFIILDESQNTTKEQMKMFLTRIGFGSKVVITGDITQTDLPHHNTSGLRHAIDILNDINEIHFTFFQVLDVVRHPLVQLIITAYEKSERR